MRINNPAYKNSYLVNTIDKEFITWLRQINIGDKVIINHNNSHYEYMVTGIMPKKVYVCVDYVFKWSEIPFKWSEVIELIKE